MDVVTGAVSSAITKLSDLLAGEYNLQMGVKGEIQFLQAELRSMKGALEKVSNTPVEQLDIQDKIWAKDLRELSYDIEDSIDTFMVRGSDDESTKLHGIRKFIDRSVGFFKKAKVHHGIATEIEDIKSRVVEVHKRRRRYEVSHGVDNMAATNIVDPRLFSQYGEVKGLVGIDETIDELAKNLMGDNGVPLQQGKTVSIVGFCGLGKTTLANAVYEKIGALFDCCAFVSVSQTPDLKKLFKGLLYDLGKNINEEILEERRLINVLREFLKPKRYFIVIDDIWDVSVWKAIKCALPDNDVGYAIIATTRNSDVARKAGGEYKLKPLSEYNSRKLLCGRIFANENNGATEKCLDEELVEVSDKILKKCAGVPLAIITVASLLACTARNKMDWYEVYNAIGTGLENSLDLENMRKILSLSYYNMPTHMRTCLLYLSVFPEDYRIRKDRLIWMWIAEGFIQCDQRGKSLFELGESYFNELINRSMTQPIYDVDGMVYACHVHDMMLDLLRSLSSEENFITILNDLDHKSPLSTIRRLSLHNGKDDGTMTPATTTMSFEQVRSLVAFTATATLKLMLTIRNFRVLRVLELQDCDLSQGYSLEYLGNLFHLRYLGLRGTHIAQLPEEIGSLQSLQILDVKRNNISCLPSTIVELRHLICMYCDDSARLPNGIGNLTSLEELSELAIDDSNMGILEDLDQLTELRVLKIVLVEWNGKIVDCLCKLQKIQDLSIWGYGGLDGWVASRQLRRLKTRWGCWFSSLSTWMNSPSLLPNLLSLSIMVREVRQADLDILGRSAIRYLNLEMDRENLGIILGGLVICTGLFPCLVQCRFWNFLVPVAFQQGSMPKLQTLKLQFSVRGLRAITSGNSGLDLGLGNLLSLQHVDVHFDPQGASNEEVEELEAALRHAIEIHHNHPQLYIQNCR